MHECFSFCSLTFVEQKSLFYTLYFIFSFQLVLLTFISHEYTNVLLIYSLVLLLKKIPFLYSILYILFSFSPSNFVLLTFFSHEYTNVLLIYSLVLLLKKISFLYSIFFFLLPTSNLVLLTSYF